MQIETFTFTDNLVTINGKTFEVVTPLPKSIKAVQFHSNIGIYYEETSQGLKEVPDTKYQAVINEWVAQLNKEEEGKEKVLAEKANPKHKKVENLRKIQSIYNGHVFDGGIVGQQLLSVRISALSDDTTLIGMPDKSNTVVDLTRVELKSILLDSINQYNSILV